MNRDTARARTLKTLLDQDVDTLGGPTAASHAFGIATSLLSRYTSISDQNVGTHIPVDMLAEIVCAITRRGGDSRVLRFLAHEAGFNLVPIAQQAATGSQLLEHAIDLQNAFTPLVTEVMEAAKDGKTDEREVNRIRERIRRLATEAAELDNDLGGTVTAFPNKGRSA